MFRIAYRSRLAGATGQSDVEDILKAAGARNSALGITGAWMICDGECLAAIEGPPLAVKEVAELIWDDHRHTGFRLVSMEHTEERMFDGWPLKYLCAGTLKDEPELLEHPGIGWLGKLGGGVEKFYGDSIMYHH